MPDPDKSYQERIDQRQQDAETTISEEALSRIRVLGRALCRISEIDDDYFEVKTKKEGNQSLLVITSGSRYSSNNPEVFQQPYIDRANKQKIIGTGIRHFVISGIAKHFLRDAEDCDEAKAIFNILTEHESNITAAVHAIPKGTINQQEQIRDSLLSEIPKLEEAKKQKASTSLTRNVRQQILPRQKEFALSLMQQMEGLGILDYNDLFNPETLTNHPEIIAIVANASRNSDNKEILLREANPEVFAQHFCLKFLQLQESQEEDISRKAMIAGILKLLHNHKNINRQDFSWHTLINAANELNSFRNRQRAEADRATIPNLDISGAEASDPQKLKTMAAVAFNRLTAWLPKNDQEARFVKDVNTIFEFLVKNS